MIQMLSLFIQPALHSPQTFSVINISTANNLVYMSLSVCLIPVIRVCFYRMFRGRMVELKNACMFAFFSVWFYFWLLLGLRCCAWVVSGCGEQALLFVGVCGLSAVASLVSGVHQLQ